MFNKNKSFWAAFHNKQMENIDDALKDTNRTVQDMPGMVQLNDIGVMELEWHVCNLVKASKLVLAVLVHSYDLH